MLFPTYVALYRIVTTNKCVIIIVLNNNIYYIIWYMTHKVITHNILKAILKENHLLANKAYVCFGI